MDESIKKGVENRLNEMLSLVDFNHVLSLNDKEGFIYLGNERASDIQLANLKSEAEFLKQSHIWKLLNETPKELAQRCMFVTSESLADLQKGKSMLYLLDNQNKVMNTLLRYTPKRK